MVVMNPLHFTQAPIELNSVDSMDVFIKSSEIVVTASAVDITAVVVSTATEFFMAIEATVSIGEVIIKIVLIGFMWWEIYKGLGF